MRSTLVGSTHNVLVTIDRCPCLSGESYAECCGRFHAGTVHAPTAELLMRSRYAAYAVGERGYLLATWHPSTRPAELELDAERRWYRLDILGKSQGGPFDTEGSVEFEAFYKGGSQYENSRFVRENGRWFYVTTV